MLRRACNPSRLAKALTLLRPNAILHSLEVIGGELAIRLEVTLAEATPVFESKPKNMGDGEIEYIPITLSTGVLQ